MRRASLILLATTILALSTMAPPTAAAEPPALDAPRAEVSVFRGTVEEIVETANELRDLPVEALDPLVGTRAAEPKIVAHSPSTDAPRDAASWLQDFERVYESGDSAAYARLLGADYRFVSPDPGIVDFRRHDELASYARLFRGVTRSDGTVLPAARHVDVVFEEVDVRPDPEFPGDVAHVLVHVGRATLAIEFADGTSMRDTAPHQFWLVLAGDGKWVCRRWVERPAEALAGGGGADPTADSRGVALAPRGVPYPNPARSGAGVSYAYEVEAAGEEVTLDLFDAAGRRVARIDGGAKPGGRHVARWNGRNEAGARAAPGVYFLAARVGPREERSRVIVVR